MVVYKIPYRRALGLAALGLAAFRPSASREQRYLAYNISGLTLLAVVATTSTPYINIIAIVERERA